MSSISLYEHQSFPFPCLSPNGIKIFTTTADQRYLLGNDEFLRTHFHVSLRSYRSDKQIILTEQEILQQLLEQESSIVGNRIFILYGAAGSGKSELLRWLQIQMSLQDPSKASVLTRIARTDLDIFHIIQRLQETYGFPPLKETSLKRWEECRQKPRTLAKIIVLSALEQLLDSDEQINALYYQLIDIVQTNLEHCFAAMSQPSEDSGQYIELFTREDLLEILRTSVVPISIEYEALHFHFLKIFREQLLEGFDFSDTLQWIAQDTQRERRQRPILLVDDLVQSINLFATDLLDYFITLEEGCWDVVIGITPNSLDATSRGRDLLNRITYLDTIDDRVQKLWLSDEYGLSSSFLNETNCAEYARLYLNEYKRQNAQLCNKTCPAFYRCYHLEPNSSENLLAPFNEELLIRLFRSLPQGKGRARYFTLYLRDILLRLAQGENLLDIVQEYVKPEWAVYHSDRKLAQVYELYGASSRESNALTLENTENQHLHLFFGMDFPPSPLPVVASLQKQSSEIIATNNNELTIDPAKEAIKAWLQGEAVNKQLLKNIRRGLVKAVKEAYSLDLMTRLYIAKPQRALRWAHTRFDTVPPVELESIDNFDGLRVKRNIGPFAYILHDFADAGGWAELALRNSLLNNEVFPALLFNSMTYRNKIQSSLKEQLGVNIEELAFSLFLLTACFNHIPSQLPASVLRKISAVTTLLPKYPDELEPERPHFTHGQIGSIKRLFDDCFKLRENIYDGFLLEQMTEHVKIEQAFAILQSIDVNNINIDFRLNEEPLSDFLNTLQQKILNLAQLRSSQKVRTKLLTIGKIGLSTDEMSQHFASLVGISKNNTETTISRFLQQCTLWELHQALCLAYNLERSQHEQLLHQLQSLLQERREEKTEKTTYDIKGFSQEEIQMLTDFVQQNFRMPLNQVEIPFLMKVSQQMPGLYHQLDLRLQRG